MNPRKALFHSLLGVLQFLHSFRTDKGADLLVAQSVFSLQRRVCSFGLVDCGEVSRRRILWQSLHFGLELIHRTFGFGSLGLKAAQGVNVQHSLGHVFAQQCIHAGTQTLVSCLIHIAPFARGVNYFVHRCNLGQNIFIGTASSKIGFIASITFLCDTASFQQSHLGLNRLKGGNGIICNGAKRINKRVDGRNFFFNTCNGGFSTSQL